MNKTLAAPTKIVSKYFIALFLCATFVSISTQMVNTTAPLFIISLGGSMSLAGGIISALSIISLVGTLAAGPLVDRIGRRVVVVVGLFFGALSLLLCNFFAIVPVYGMLRGIQTLGTSAAASGEGAILSDIVPHDKLGKASAYYGVTHTVATAAGPALALAIILDEGTNFSYVFYASTLLMIMSLISILYCNYEKKGFGNRQVSPLPEHPVTPDKGGFFQKFIEPKVLPAFFTNFCFFVACGFTVHFLVLYAKEFNIQHVSVFFTIQAIGMFASRLFSGWLVDRFGPFLPCVLGYSMGILTFIMILLASGTGFLIFIGAGLYGCALGLVGPPLYTIAVRSASAHRRGVALSTYSISIGVGVGISGVLLGVLIDNFGYLNALAACSALSAVSVILSILFFRKSPADV